MNLARFGQSIRAVRRKKGWSQDELARHANVSQGTVSRAERGAAGTLSVAALDRLARALGARASLKLYWEGENLDRLLDAAHAGLVEQVVLLLRVSGWEVLPEVTFNEFGERGSIDILAYHPGHRALLVVEVKSTVPDIQDMLAAFDRKVRLAPKLANDRGWTVAHVSRLLVVTDDSTSRRRLAAHRATIGRVVPERTLAVRRWIRRPATAFGGVLFLEPRQGNGPRPRR